VCAVFQRYSVLSSLFGEIKFVYFVANVILITQSTKQSEQKLISRLKNIVTLKTRLGVTQGNFEMVPFDRSHTSSYFSSIVPMDISCIVSEML